MTTLFDCLTIDIIGDLAFGEDFGSLDAGGLQPRLQKLFTALKQFTFVKEILRLPPMIARTITTVLSAVMTRRGTPVNGVGADVMMKRRAKSEVESEVFIYTMDALLMAIVMAIFAVWYIGDLQPKKASDDASGLSSNTGYPMMEARVHSKGGAGRSPC